MNNTKLILQLSSKIIELAKDEFDNHGCNDLDKEIYQLIPQEWCEEARQMNSGGKDPWPESPKNFTDSGLMWFLSKKLIEISNQLDRDNKLNELGI